MSIQIQPKSSDELAAALREPTASPDDLLRIERGLARKLRERSAGSPARRLVPVGLLLATLAAAVLSWWARPLDGPAPVPVATLDAARVGQVIEGPEPTEAQLGNARLAVGAGSSIHVDAIDIAGASVTLTRGEVHVAFHPQHRGEEHLAVLTAAARVDVSSRPARAGAL